ncbi:hypothetical protein V6N11_012298 [Hibiscus sabdariffa]|uniref:Uncharacterized protein n=1 Tax=Hibiscus sabdariffa TaxID=183260 RepID=A0ABR2QAS3_9ROSI
MLNFLQTMFIVFYYCRFVINDIASAIDEEDVTKFTDVVKKFDSMTPLDSWKTTLFTSSEGKAESQRNGRRRSY